MAWARHVCRRTNNRRKRVLNNASSEPAKIERLTVNAQEAAEMLGVSARTVFQLTKAGKLPHKKIGARVVYSIEALRRFVNEPEN